MSTRNISLPESLKTFVDDQVDQRGYGTSSEYVRELIRRDQDRVRLRGLLLAGAASAPAGEAPPGPTSTTCASASAGPTDRREAVRDRPVIPREQANRDVEDAIAFYLGEGADAAARDFIDALERAYAQFGHLPASGSPRYAQELNLPGLRCWPLSRHPWLIFYMEGADHIDVWRVLHGKRDTPAWWRDRKPGEAQPNILR